MFNDAARKFFDKFHMGKVYYISKGTLKDANKQFKTVQNDYEMTLIENSEVEEASNEPTFIPKTKFSFTPIDELGPYINGRELVAASEIPSAPLVQVRDQATNVCINILYSYRIFCATVSSSGQLILPEALKLLPLYTLGTF
ncbi:hypothetical protein ACS0TY_021301 [Phlomoides rotata]